MCHNQFLATLLQALVNVEHVNCPDSLVVYIYKYINKGTDQALVELREQKIQEAKEGNHDMDIDECVEYQQMCVITACEAAWRHLGYKLHDMSHTVLELKINEPNKEFLMVEEDDEHNALQRAKRRPNTSQLTAYFALCSVPVVGTMSYLQVPLQYTWNPSTFEWQKRKKRMDIITRLRWVNLQHSELFAIRQLLLHRINVSSFLDLQTVDGQLYQTFREAAVAAGLLSTDDEWGQAMSEAYVSSCLPLRVALSP